MTRTAIRTLAAAAVIFAVALGAGAAGLAGAASPPGRARLPYPGAPPTVPHDLEDRKALCQDCHATGDNGAPLTPHPTRTHFCIACHVPQADGVKPFVSPVQPR